MCLFGDDGLFSHKDCGNELCGDEEEGDDLLWAPIWKVDCLGGESGDGGRGGDGDDDGLFLVYFDHCCERAEVYSFVSIREGHGDQRFGAFVGLLLRVYGCLEVDDCLMNIVEGKQAIGTVFEVICWRVWELVSIVLSFPRLVYLLLMMLICFFQWNDRALSFFGHI